MQNIGKLIVIEGLEGAGKSTALTLILDILKEKNIEALSAREPGGTLISEELRHILKNSQYKALMDPKTELLLIYAARVQLIEELIKPALHRGCWVVLDRFELSTFAYQGGGRQLSESIIKILSSFCLQDLTVDLTLFMDIPPDVGMQRVKQRGEQDRFEKEDNDFFIKVYDKYISTLSYTPNSVKIDANRSLHEVQLSIKYIMEQFIAVNHV